MEAKAGSVCRYKCNHCKEEHQAKLLAGASPKIQHTCSSWSNNKGNRITMTVIGYDANVCTFGSV